jgi:hypothetical protein
MKNRKSWSIAVTLVASLLVTMSVLMPGILLSKTEDSILGSPSTVSDGIFSSQQPGPNVTSTPTTQVTQSVEQLTRSVTLFEQGAANSVLSNVPTNMKEVTYASIQQITTLLHKRALPPLDGFPQAYALKEQLRTITDTDGNPLLQYWNMNFSTQADQSPNNVVNFTVAVDAQTGMFLSLDLSIQRVKFTPMLIKDSQIDLVNSTNIIAQSMHIAGKMLSVDQSQVPSTAQWQFNNSFLLMQVTLDQQDTYTHFRMTMSAK